LLKEINHTFLALILKVSTPLTVSDYRPIPCCNVIYKCISKILTNRIIDGIKEVVSDNQSAFVPDDLFIFARGEVDSASIIMKSLEEFKNTSRLVPSIAKSTALFCNVPNHVKLAILSIMPFSEGDLPIKYLGVPLISSRLLNKDSKILVEKAKNKIGDWKNKSLSFAGRLQLCKSVISSMHVYWASVLIIPKGIIYDIQSLIRGFLWCNGEYKRGKAKVLQLRDYVMPFFWVKLGNGHSALVCKRSAKSSIARLLLAATTYFVWLERNNRLFKNVKRTPEELNDCIMVTVRLKLLTFRFKNSANVTRLYFSLEVRMDGSDIYKAANSIRLGSLRVGSSSRASSLRNGSTSVWRNSGMDAFSKSVPDDRRHILDRLVKTADEDNEGFLLKLRNRLDRVGIELPTIEVKYEHVTVEADVNTGSRALPSFINFHIELVETLLSLFHVLPAAKRHITILDDVSGIVKPKRMTLLLGPPSSGKTSLLLSMAGTLAKELKCSGKVTYNGHELHEFVPERTSAYISQNDVHIGEMTVRETLAFSARIHLQTFSDMLAELSRRERDANIKPDPDLDIFMKAAATEGQEANVVTDYTLKLLGLDICADTMVGDQMIRGISGGQRKRVTTGEMIVGPSKVLLMDEISTGLDSSTTFQIVKSLKQFIHILEGTAVISLLQPAPETYDLFDDIILLTDGKIVYQGPREHVLEFFESMGFKCPERKGVADFLQEVTSKKDQQQYWKRRDMPYRFVTAKEFAEAYQSFHVGRKLATNLATPYDKSKSHPAALTTEKYGLNKKELLKACTDREILLMKRNSFVYFFKLAQLTVMAFISMTVFFRTEMHKRTLTDGGFYTAASFFEAAVWTILTYYVMGFDPNVARFFKYFLILMLVNQMSSGLFRFIGALGRNMIVANTFGSFALLLVFALGGFILSRGLVDMGILDITHDVCYEWNSCERVPWP
ncbi:pleiotropic drug resistance protein 1, partial [Tanacetum coccineum]